MSGAFVTILENPSALVSFVLALSLAQCATVEWTGYYVTESEDKTTCFPTELYISTVNDVVYYAWLWDKSESCKEKDLDEGIFASVAQKPEATITLKNRVSADGTDATLTINEGKITFKASTGAEDVVYTKKAAEPTQKWDGTWAMKETPTSDVECYPKDQVSIKTTKTEMKFSWKWDSSKTCEAGGLSGKSFDFSVPVIPGDQVLLLVLLADEKKRFR